MELQWIFEPDVLAGADVFVAFDRAHPAFEAETPAVLSRSAAWPPIGGVAVAAELGPLRRAIETSTFLCRATSKPAARRESTASGSESLARATS